MPLREAASAAGTIGRQTTQHNIQQPNDGAATRAAVRAMRGAEGLKWW